MAGKNARMIDNKFLTSGDDAKSIEYNPASGGQKSVAVGPRLLPINIGASSWTTDASTARAVPLGSTLYIYNNSSTAYSITVGQTSSVAAKAIGAVDASGNVGVACEPNSWTYLSVGNNGWIITNNSALIVYIVEDPTFFVQQTGAFVQQNVPGYVPPINS